MVFPHHHPIRFRNKKETSKDIWYLMIDHMGKVPSKEDQAKEILKRLDSDDDIMSWFNKLLI